MNPHMPAAPTKTPNENAITIILMASLLPNRSRTPAEGFAPACGGGQVVDGGFIVEGEHIPTKTRGIASEIDSCEVGADNERCVADADDTTGNRDAG